MKEYIVMEASSIDTLMKDVNLMIKDGWKPQGGIAIDKEISENRLPRIKYMFYQALVR